MKPASPQAKECVIRADQSDASSSWWALSWSVCADPPRHLTPPFHHLLKSGSTNKLQLLSTCSSHTPFLLLNFYLFLCLHLIICSGKSLQNTFRIYWHTIKHHCRSYQKPPAVLKKDGCILISLQLLTLNPKNDARAAEAAWENI